MINIPMINIPTVNQSVIPGTPETPKFPPSLENPPQPLVGNPCSRVKETVEYSQ